MNPISRTTVQCIMSDPGIALPRQLRAHFSAIRSELSRTSEGEPFIDSVRIWFNRFERDFSERRLQPEVVRDTYLDELVELIRNPLTHRLPGYRGRVVVDNVIYETHPIMRSLLDFIRQYRPELIPTEAEERREEIRALTSSLAIQSFQTLREEFRRDIDRMNQDNDREVGELHEMLASLEDRIPQLESDIDDLNREIERVRGSVNQAKIEELNLKHSVAEVRAAIAKKRKGWLKDVLTAAAVVTVALVATWGLTALTAGTSASAAVTPTAAGGGKIGISLTF